MNRRTFAGAVVLGAASLGLAACSREEPEQPSISDIIVTNRSFSTLAAALAQTDLLEPLDVEGPVTLFAPRNSAFNELPEGTLEALLLPENRDQLAGILRHHVVPGLYPAIDLLDRTTSLTTASGRLLIADGFDGVDIDGIRVIQPDIRAGNGIIHVIDGILVP